MDELDLNKLFGKMSTLEMEAYAEKIAGEILSVVSADKGGKYIKVNGEEIDITSNAKDKDTLQALLASEMKFYLPDYAKDFLERRIQKKANPWNGVSTLCESKSSSQTDENKEKVEVRNHSQSSRDNAIEEDLLP